MPTLPSFTIPNPAPDAPPELQQLTDIVLGGLKWAAIVGGVGGLLICSLMIVFGRRGRNQLAMDGVTGSLWVVAGIALASTSSTIVGIFVL